jgi:hypothetical protein
MEHMGTAAGPVFGGFRVNMRAVQQPSLEYRQSDARTGAVT